MMYMPSCCRPQYYKLLEQCVSQIVLHKSGIDPDFHYTKKFSLDVDPLIGKLHPLPIPSAKEWGCIPWGREEWPSTLTQY